MAYIMRIDTMKYKDHKNISRKNWEPGTMDDYMHAINGISRRLRSEREVLWQLKLFQGESFLSSEWSENNPKENHGLSNRYVKFLKKNQITYHDRLCDCERTRPLSGYGFMQGYFDIDKYLNILKETGVIQIPFSALYDIRQYDKCMNGCYMEIKKYNGGKNK